MLFLPWREKPVSFRCAGWIGLTILHWRVSLCDGISMVDITVVPDNEIMRHRRIAMLELVQKHMRQRDLMGLVEALSGIRLRETLTDGQLSAV